MDEVQRGLCQLTLVMLYSLLCLHFALQALVGSVWSGSELPDMVLSNLLLQTQI